MENINAIIATIANIHNSANKLIVEELKNHNLEGLAPSHGDILIVLYHNVDGVPMSKITTSINKDKSTVTALVNKLEKLELIEKFKHESDSRSTMIRLSKKGLQTKPVVDKISEKLLSTTYQGFSNEEKKKMVNLLERVKANFKE